LLQSAHPSRQARSEAGETIVTHRSIQPNRTGGTRVDTRGWRPSRRRATALRLLDADFSLARGQAIVCAFRPLGALR